MECTSRKETPRKHITGNYRITAATRPEVETTAESETQKAKNRDEIPHRSVEEEAGDVAECPQGAMWLILGIAELTEVAKHRQTKEAIANGTLRKIARQDNARAMRNTITGSRAEELDTGSDRAMQKTSATGFRTTVKVITLIFAHYVLNVPLFYLDRALSLSRLA